MSWVDRKGSSACRCLGCAQGVEWSGEAYTIFLPGCDAPAGRNRIAVFAILPDVGREIRPMLCSLRAQRVEYNKRAGHVDEGALLVSFDHPRSRKRRTTFQEQVHDTS